MSTLRQELLLFGTLAIAFVLFSVYVASGGMTQTDHQVHRLFIDLWQPSLRLLFVGIALLGGVEVTGLVLLGLAVYLVYRGYGSDVLALLVYPAAQVLEVVYKRVVTQPAPLAAVAHGDAPSVINVLLGSDVAGNSFPSGHMVRTVLVYGLLAFVVWRLARARNARAIAVVLAGALVLLEGLDRLYLGVHWESDVVGGALLGGTCLLAAMLWLDRPRRVG